jgi:hypothetical protein
MSVFITKKSAPYYWYSFQIQRRRFFGSTRCTSRKDAERFEALERERAKDLVKATQRAATSLALDDVAARLWTDSAQYDASPDTAFANIARLVDYFGKTALLTDIDHAKAKKLVAWRRGHRVARRKNPNNAPLISNATVNRSTTQVLQRLFNFAKAEGVRFEREPKWVTCCYRNRSSVFASYRPRKPTPSTSTCATTTRRSLPSPAPPACVCASA